MIYSSPQAQEMSPVQKAEYDVLLLLICAHHKDQGQQGCSYRGVEVVVSPRPWCLR